MSSRRTILGLLLSLTCGLATAGIAFAKSSDFFAPDGLAIHGYDPVAYIEDGKAARGSDNFDLMWGGAIWRFVSAEHMAAFEANPWRYAPQYGGYCAYAVSRGSVTSTVPDAWAVVNDKLYLTYSKAVRSIWKADVSGNIAAADANWPSVLGK